MVASRPSRTWLPVRDLSLALDGPQRRAFSSVNVRRDDKEVFDLVQGFLSVRRGRTLHQWEVFNILLADALANEGEGAELRGFRALVRA